MCASINTARARAHIPWRNTTTEAGVPPLTGGRSRNVSGSPLGSCASRSTKPDRAAACAARERMAASASAADDDAHRADTCARARTCHLHPHRMLMLMLSEFAPLPISASEAART